jgi:AAA ATPase-like protein
MIKSVEINNYRCFEKASLQNCQRVNVIVGDNGSGKTALLESLFMSSAPSPELAIRLKRWRGYETNSFSGSLTDIEESLWGELFHNFEKQRSILITVEGSREQNRTLRINYRVRERWVAIKTSGRRTAEKHRPTPITFIWTGPDRRPQIIPVTIDREGKLAFPIIQELPVESSYFGSNLTHMPGETVNRFSALNKVSGTNENCKIPQRRFRHR